jgi:hypothetical protein
VITGAVMLALACVVGLPFYQSLRRAAASGVRHPVPVHADSAYQTLVSAQSIDSLSGLPILVVHGGLVFRGWGLMPSSSRSRTRRAA